jgi:hypothetical protein
LRLTSPLNLPAPGRRQWLYGDSSSWQPPVFLLNSRLGRFSAAGFSSKARSLLPWYRHPFSRSYGVMLPSSFSTDHSSTLGFSPRLPVSVCGTVGCCIPARGFSRRPASRTLGRSKLLHSASGLTYGRVFSLSPRLPRCIGTSSTRRLFCFRVPPGNQHTTTGTGMFARFPSSTALALDLGAG